MASPPNPRAQLVLSRVAAWNRAHPDRQIDPQAELAVAGTEGLSGDIGDGGHAFGPNQANDAGGVLTGKLRGLTTQQKQKWAWSPQGIDFQLAGVAGAAGGLHGEAAVRSIVSKYERPADPQGEIARALAGLGGAGAGPSSLPPATALAPAAAALTAPPPQADPRRQFAQQLIAGMNQNGTLDQAALLGALQQRRAMMDTPPPSLPAPAVQPLPAAPGATLTAQPLANTPGRSGFAELLHEGVGGPTHSTGEHIHFASTDPQTELRAIKLAESLGLSVRENPYTGDTVDPVHAKNSYHYRTFPGKFNGRKLGEAADASGDRAAMLKLYQLLGGR